MRLCASDCVDTQAHEPPRSCSLTQVKDLGLQLRRPVDDAPIQRGLVVGAVTSPSNGLNVKPGDLLVAVNGQSLDQMSFSSALKLIEKSPKPLKMVFEVSPIGRAIPQPTVQANQRLEGSLIRTSTTRVEALNFVDRAEDISAYVRPSASNGATRVCGATDEIAGLSESQFLPPIQESMPAEDVRVIRANDQQSIPSDTSMNGSLSVSHGPLEMPHEEPPGNLDQRWCSPIKELVMKNRCSTIRRGFMFKENRRWTKKWNYYFFVLSPLKIECFLGDSTATLFDEMSFFNRRCSVRSLPGAQDVIINFPVSQLTNQYLLELRAGNQEWVLACKSETEKHEWLRALQLAVDASNNSRSIERSSICVPTSQRKEKRRKCRPTASSDGAIMDHQSRFSNSQPPVSAPKVYATVMSADNLTKPGSTVNPVCEIKMGAQTFQTGVARNERSPQWKHDNKVVFMASSDCLVLKIRILDEVYPGSFRLISKLSIPLAQLPNLKTVEKNYPLVLENGSSDAALKLSLKYVDEVKDLHSRLRGALDQFEADAGRESMVKLDYEAESVGIKLAEALDLCSQMYEAEKMVKYVHDRLLDLHSVVSNECSEGSAQLSSVWNQQVMFNRILWRFRMCLKAFSGKKMLIRLVTNRALLDKLHYIHEELDELIIHCNLLAPNPIHNWEQQWKKDLQANHSFIQYVWEHKNSLLDQFQDETTQTEALMLMGFECKQRKSIYSAKEVRLIRDIFQHVLRLFNLSFPSVSKWFIPRNEVDFDADTYFATGSYGLIHHGFWSGIPVVVKRVRLENDPDRKMFQREADIWHKLHHSHIVRLFGACDFGDPFFISEYASNGTLSNYLYHGSQNTWAKLYEASLGLLYLHTKQGIIHGDLKCNNILVAADGTVKITDFGSSFEISQPPPPTDLDSLGAIQWKAPEILAGQAGTFATDIYAFGMCILEAVKGGNPWGEVPDKSVTRIVLNGSKLPNKPDRMTDLQWQLVQQMCAFDPTERIDITLVAEKLKEFASSEQWNLIDAEWEQQQGVVVDGTWMNETFDNDNIDT